jgi:hypothetical protein
MTGNEVKKIIQAMYLWAERHPAPNKPFIELGLGQALTPREMAEAVNDFKDERGKLLLQIIEAGAERFTLEEILEDLAPEGQGDVYHSAGNSSE